MKETSLATAPVKETVYWNYRQRPSRDGAYVVRSSLPPAPLTRAATAAISALDPEVALFDVLPMDTRIGRSLGPERTPMVLTALFAVTALGLAVIGVYAVLNWSVTQRTGDIGVRVALGATADHVARLVLGHGIRLLGIGLVSGLLCAAALGRVLSAQIRDVSATDPMVFAAAAFALACAALAAVWLPARRAARIEPMRALRAD